MQVFSATPYNSGEEHERAERRSPNLPFENWVIRMTACMEGKSLMQEVFDCPRHLRKCFLLFSLVKLACFISVWL